jgi:hypothetical protein
MTKNNEKNDSNYSNNNNHDAISLLKNKVSVHQKNDSQM